MMETKPGVGCPFIQKHRQKTPPPAKKKTNKAVVINHGPLFDIPDHTVSVNFVIYTGPEVCALPVTKVREISLDAVNNMAIKTYFLLANTKPIHVEFVQVVDFNNRRTLHNHGLDDIKNRQLVFAMNKPTVISHSDPDASMPDSPISHSHRNIH